MEFNLGVLARGQDIFEDSRDFEKVPKTKNPAVFTLGLFVIY
jgi:hypothetical protein